MARVLNGCLRLISLRFWAKEVLGLGKIFLGFGVWVRLEI